jgi:hypothetical protein
MAISIWAITGAITNGTHLLVGRQWLAPTGYTSVSELVEARVDETLASTLSGPDGGVLRISHPLSPQIQYETGKLSTQLDRQLKTHNNWHERRRQIHGRDSDTQATSTRSKGRG